MTDYAKPVSEIIPERDAELGAGRVDFVPKIIRFRAKCGRFLLQTHSCARASERRTARIPGLGGVFGPLYVPSDCPIRNAGFGQNPGRHAADIAVLAVDVHDNDAVP